LKVTFLGTGVSVPYENRAQSSILLKDSVNVLFDIGAGALLRLEQVGVDVCDVDAVCITHHHLDHNADLFNLLKARWLVNCTSELEIYGPPGTKNFIESLLEAYSYLRQKLKFKVYEEEEFKVGNLRIRAVPTIHSIESRGYVVDDILAISGDTKAFKEFMSIDCDVMIHELSLPFGYVPDFHTTPENLKENLKYCVAEKIYLVHLYPMTHLIRDKILSFLGSGLEIANDLTTLRI